MTDIDLVPHDYRVMTWLRSSTKKTLTAIGMSLLVTVLVYAGLHLLSGRLDQRISELQSQQAITTQQREALTQLDGHRVELDRKLNLLTGLRGGTVATRMFVTIDRAITDDEVWFLDWQFRRAGTTVERKEHTASNGYFIMIPAEDGKESTAAWKIETHMTFKGQARDHSALSGFVRRLYQQPEIQDVRILDTSKDPQGKFVNFNLAVIVNSGGVNS
jgi:hypothetical protein